MIKKMEELDEEGIKFIITEYYKDRRMEVVDIALSCHTDNERGMSSTYVTATVEIK